MLRGTVHIEHSDGVAVVQPGQLAHLTKGERVRWVFPDAEGAEYIPVCLPAFSPNNVRREEGTGARLAATQESGQPALYHLVQKQPWEKAKREGSVYYPPTYKQDGFTHATAKPEVLPSSCGKDWYIDAQGGDSCPTSILCLLALPLFIHTTEPKARLLLYVLPRLPFTFCCLCLAASPRGCKPFLQEHRRRVALLGDDSGFPQGGRDQDHLRGSSTCGGHGCHVHHRAVSSCIRRHPDPPRSGDP